MNRLPDIVVLDFCDWLCNYTQGRYSNKTDVLDILSNWDMLEEYAQLFLQQRKDLSVGYTRGEMFLRLLSGQGKMPTNYTDITPSHLADNTRYVISDSDEATRLAPRLLSLVVQSGKEISEVVDFVEWANNNGKELRTIQKMPFKILEDLVNNYISSTKKGNHEKEQLLKAYNQTSWNTFVDRFRVLMRMGRHRPVKDISTIISRYCRHEAQFNCVILPLADKTSQRNYRSLISDHWDNLNDTSENYLDIFYSEADNGKSGFDIANRISSLPDSLRKKAPCLIIWKSTVKEAGSIPINDLTNAQIVEVIKVIVQTIQQENNIDNVIKEACEKVKEQQLLNHGVNYYHVEGHGNTFGDNNKVNTSIIIGDNNVTDFSTSSADIQHVIYQFDEALRAVNASSELDVEMKKALCGIIEDAKAATLEKSEEKKSVPKKAFGYFRDFLVKNAPILLDTLANLAQIAMFFGLKG